MTDVFNETFILTDDNFEVFKDEFMYWVGVYGLKGWELHFVFDDDENSDCRAQIARDHNGRIAVVMLTKKWVGEEPTDRNVRKCGYHEASELLLSKLNDICRARTFSDNQIEEEIHNIIRILENQHWQPEYIRRVEDESHSED